MNLISYCMPVTRLDKYKNMINSIEAVDFATCNYLVDKDTNQNKCRNNCVKKALKTDGKVIGFVDDDDIGVNNIVLLVANSLEHVDVVYTNHHQLDKFNHMLQKKHTGDVKFDINKIIEPYEIFMKYSVAENLLSTFDEIFNEKILNLDGSYLMFRLYMLGFKIKYLPISSYIRNVTNPFDSVGYRNKDCAKGVMQHINLKMNYKMFN